MLRDRSKITEFEESLVVDKHNKENSKGSKILLFLVERHIVIKQAKIGYLNYPQPMQY